MRNKRDKPDKLRTEAEAQLDHAPQSETPTRSADELLHELQVYQVELEMQNEALRHTQVALEESRDRYVDLYEFSPVGYLTLGHDGMIAEVNLTGAALLGVERKKLLRHRFAGFITPDDRDRWHHYFLTELQRDEMQSCELKLRRGDDSVFHARLECQRMEMNYGDASSVRIVLADITRSKQLEKESQERRLEMAELQKLHIAAQTASAIAHELNQPLLAIAAYSEAVLMLLQAANPDLDKVRKAVEKIERQSHRAGYSIHEMLESLSLHNFSTEDFNLNREIVAVLDDAKNEHELQFHTTLRLEENLPSVRANRTHVQKALFNLLYNSIEAMHEAGVPLPVITIRTSKAENFVQMTIQDNGPGFRNEDAQRLFEPFFTTKADGFGMGLSISRSLIESNGGQIWVDPQKNTRECSGATFHVTLPFAI